MPAVAVSKVGPNEIKLPHKFATAMREGERLSVEPMPAELQAPPPGRGSKSKAAPDPRASHGDAAAAAAPVVEKPQVQHAAPPPMEWDAIGDMVLDDIAGMDDVKARVDEALYYLTHPEWFLIQKLLPPRVFLLFGPYGCGKTMLAKAMANRLTKPEMGGISLDVKLKNIRSTDIKDSYLGQSAKHIHQILDSAREACNKGSTVLLILDEIDSLVSNRADKDTHEEYRDVVNSLIQDIQGVQDLDTESRIRMLWQDKEVVEVRNEIAEIVRAKGKRDSQGDIRLGEKDWPGEVRAKMLALRKRITDAGGVSTVIVLGTTNDPLRVDEAFISRAGSNIFFVSRPSPSAIEKMLAQNLDQNFFELTPAERRTLAEDAFAAGLTGRDIMLSWMQPLRQLAPGSLTIMGFQTVHARRPQPVVGVEWEIDLFKRLRKKGQSALAEQIGFYMADLKKALPAIEGQLADGPDAAPSAGGALAGQGTGRPTTALVDL